ncbi:MAG: lysylphosphatidylglycerol synthase transmembrane domain-containing protein [Patescibacteria group bacterium]
MKTLRGIFINSAIGLILILIWFQFVDLEEIFSTLSNLKFLNLIPVFLFMLASPVIRAIRLKIFLKNIKDIALKDLIFLNGVAMMLNFYIPIRAGEIAKGIYLNTRFGLPLAKSVIWVFLDRFVDFLVVLLLAAVLLLLIPTALDINIIIFITIIFATALVLTYFAIFQITFTRKMIGFLKHLLIFNDIKIYFDRFSIFILESFSILKRHPRDLFLLSLFTVLGYIADAYIWYFTFIALGFPQNFLKMYLGQLLSALTYLIPAAPGYVGSAEASGLLILSGVFGIGANLASAMTVLFHILSAVFILIFGIVSAFFLKIDLGLILKKALRKGN